MSRNTVQSHGENSQFWDRNWQATIELRGASWVITGNPEAVNITMCNGIAVGDERELAHGDELGVGNPETGIFKPLFTVDLGIPGEVPAPRLEEST